MYSLGNGIYTHEQIEAALRDNREVAFEYELLDKNDNSLGTVSATGTIDFNAEAKIKRMANLTITDDSAIDFLSDRIRPYMKLRLDGEWLKFPLGVFLMSTPRRRAINGIVERVVECYDKTQILADDKFTSRYLIPSGTNYIVAVSTILQSAGFDMNLVEQSSKVTVSDIEFAAGTSKLDAVNQLLKAVNYTDIYADSLGTLVAREYRQPELRAMDATYVTDKNSIVFSGADDELDAFGLPNKIVRYLESADRQYLSAEVTNTDPSSKLSTVSRGRVIVDIQPVNDIADQATLTSYVQRLMAETKTYQRITFSTALVPNHECLDCLYIVNKELGISGKCIETAWRMDLKVGGTMTHTVRKEATL